MGISIFGGGIRGPQMQRDGQDRRPPVKKKKPGIVWKFKFTSRGKRTINRVDFVLIRGSKGVERVPGKGIRLRLDEIDIGRVIRVTLIRSTRLVRINLPDGEQRTVHSWKNIPDGTILDTPFPAMEGIELESVKRADVSWRFRIDTPLPRRAGERGVHFIAKPELVAQVKKHPNFRHIF